MVERTNSPPKIHSPPLKIQVPLCLRQCLPSQELCCQNFMHLGAAMWQVAIHGMEAEKRGATSGACGEEASVSHALAPPAASEVLEVGNCRAWGA